MIKNKASFPKIILAVIILISFGTALGVVVHLMKNKPAPIVVQPQISSTPKPSVISNISSPSDLTSEVLENAKYNSLFWKGKEIELKNGSYTETYPDSASVGYLGIFDIQHHDEKIVFGDLNGDGNKDAAVILDSHFGGSGHFYELAIVINKNGTPFHLASENLGDRVTINSIEINVGKIIIDMTTRESDRKIFEYELSENKLVKIEEYNYEEIMPSDIVGWEKYQNNKYKFSINYPESWRADTNSFAGEPNMIFCSPDFFVEKNSGWLSWTENPDKKGCASNRRIWDNGKTIKIEGIGDVSPDEYNRVWKEKINKPISSISLFVSYEKENYADKVSHIYLGNNSSGYWYLIKNGNDAENPDVFNKMSSTFKFIDL